MLGKIEYKTSLNPSAVHRGRAPFHLVVKLFPEDERIVLFPMSCGYKHKKKGLMLHCSKIVMLLMLYV
jgi:hypothetical protein